MIVFWHKFIHENKLFWKIVCRNDVENEKCKRIIAYDEEIMSTAHKSSI